MSEEWLNRVQYGNFSLEGFRNDAAAIVKYFIRAREQFQPGFLGPESEYASWSLENIASENLTAVQLLRQVKVLSSIIDAHMVSMGGSGGVLPDDPLADFKFAVAIFVNRHLLAESIEALESGGKVNLKPLAEWDQLPEIRKGLDLLNQRIGTSAGNSTIPEVELVAESERVMLFPWGTKPVVVIDTKCFDSLTRPQYEVVKVLLEAGERKTTLRLLEKKSKHNDARGILKRLRDSDPLWKCVIGMAGRPNGRYHIY